MNPKRNRARDVGFYVLLLLILIAVIFTMTKDTEPDQLDNYSELVDLFNDGKVQSFRTEGNKIILTLRSDSTDKTTVEKTYDLYSFGVFYEDFNELIKEQHEKGILEKYDYNEGFVVPWWASIIPYLILMGGAMVLWYVMMNRMGGGAGGVARFSKARTRLGSDEKNKKTFADVAGCDEEKEELAEIVEFLKDPKAYTAMGARIPKGVLLVGPPGTGKTLLAKAVAGEAGVQFLSISGSDFVELYVGVGAGRVRDLFEQAKKAAPAIIFIDEIDAVGRQRGSGLGGGHDEREQTLNQLLVEMDGFGNNEGVIVMAATNRADILDNALLRPGRFDRQVYVGLPDIRGREAILKIHSRDKQLGDDVDLNSIAKGTPGFAGADLENLMNEAALLAVRRKHRFITMEDIDEAILKVQMGPEKKSRKMSDKAKRLTAYHESGHAADADPGPAVLQLRIKQDIRIHTAEDRTEDLCLCVRLGAQGYDGISGTGDHVYALITAKGIRGGIIPFDFAAVPREGHEQPIVIAEDAGHGEEGVLIRSVPGCPDGCLIRRAVQQRYGVVPLRGNAVLPGIEPFAFPYGRKVFVPDPADKGNGIFTDADPAPFSLCFQALRRHALEDLCQDFSVRGGAEVRALGIADLHRFRGGSEGEANQGDGQDDKQKSAFHAFSSNPVGGLIPGRETRIQITTGSAAAR